MLCLRIYRFDDQFDAILNGQSTKSEESRTIYSPVRDSAPLENNYSSAQKVIDHFELSLNVLRNLEGAPFLKTHADVAEVAISNCISICLLS